MIYIIVIVFGAVLSILGPWWIAAPLAWIASRWKASTAKQAMLQSAAALITLWLGMAILSHSGSAVNMPEMISGVLTSTPKGLGETENMLLVFGLTTLLAGIIGLLSGLAGYRMKAFSKK
ncbi:hypothetical protein [Jiulongibacter sp. NS-SX5]|uniref:hypothetical protein n=1 Tax=Jiulongibacter sp. NS-SX5 TaxID=3463854 RepID=UPI0040580F54